MSHDAVSRQGAGIARWEGRYARLLVASDVAVIAVVSAAVLLLAPHPAVLRVPQTSIAVHSALISVCLGAMVLLLLSATGTRAPRVVGVGSAEYSAVARSVLFGYTSVALLVYVLNLGGLRFVLAFGLVWTGAALLVSRWAWRRWLVAQRRRARMCNRVLLVGSEESVARAASDLARTPAAGLLVVGACTPSGRVADCIPGTDIAVSGSVEKVLPALRRVDADTVLIASANELSPATVRSLSWDLEPGRHHLIVAPSLTDIGGPRLHTRPVAGLPLMHVETPRYSGGKLYAKRAFDLVSAAAIVLVISPVLIVVATAVGLTTPGGVFFRQERIGRRGDKFYMLKFRSMYTDAEARLEELAASAARDRGNAVMFKMKDDPRVTKVGKILRRFSLDELPQLFNVLRGDMSLVGPRPPLDREVQQYADMVHRRFLVKPGITGLWQVSGRSNLDWDETVRLDLYYVENWTLTGDLTILLKTVRAVLQSDGAY
ncbi:sugar transferase [Microbacterium aurum]